MTIGRRSSYFKIGAAAYLYMEDAQNWPTTPTTSLSDPAAAANDDFGYPVAVWGKAEPGLDQTNVSWPVRP